MRLLTDIEINSQAGSCNPEPGAGIIIVQHKRIMLALTLLVMIVVPLFPQQSDGTCGPLLRETVLLATDRSIYLAGDNINITATLLEADSYYISSLSSITRVEILNSRGKAIIQERYSLAGGKVSQSIPIPGDMASGWYQVRAYTGWMRNFEAERFSYVNIRIINPADLNEISLRDNPDTLTISLVAGYGGFVSGLEATFAIRSTDQYGIPQSTKGIITTATGDSVASFTTGETGWGSVKFTPESGKDYIFNPAVDKSCRVISKFPTIKEEGSEVTTKLSDGILEISLKTAGKNQGGEVRMLVHGLYTWYIYDSSEITGNQATFSLLTEKLPRGILQLTFFDAQGELIDKRLVIPGDPLGAGASVSAETEVKGEREMTATYNSGDGTAERNYTLIIRKKEPSEQSLLYIPGLPGWNAGREIPVNSTEREGWLIASCYENNIALSFFSCNSNQPASGLLNFNDISSKREALFDFMPETRGLTINGIITVAGSDEPVFNEIVSLTVLKDNYLYTAKTFSSGRFHFTLPGRIGDDDLILSYTRAPGGDWILKRFPDFDERTPSLPPAGYTLTTAELEYVRNLSISMQIGSIFSDKADSLTTIIPADQNRKVFFGYPDEVILIDDYIRLPNIREVLFEVVPSVVTKKEGDEYLIQVIKSTPFPKSYHPLILLDGIPMIHFNKFLELPPDRLRKVEVINTLYIHGNTVFAGVVNFISVNSDLAGLELPAGSEIISIKMPVASTDIPPEVKIPVSPYKPVMGNILTIETSLPGGRGKVNFTPNDDYGDYIMILNGFNSMGKWVNAAGEFRVEGKYRQ